MNVYITDEHYAQAEAIGVSRELLSARVRQSFWDIERAITTPPIRHRRELPEPWATIARQNGIRLDTFAGRLRRGWSPEEAATVTIEASHAAGAAKRRFLTDEEQVLAAASGLSHEGILLRLRRGWSREEALTTPAIPRNERHARGREITKALGGAST